MMQVAKWSAKPVLPGVIIDAAKNTKIGNTPFLSWFRDTSSSLYEVWVAAETYLDWAQAGLLEGNANGFDTALTYAKRAACRRIDGFLAYNHLSKFDRKSYPEKCDILRKVGINIPSIVHDLVIDPRNESEHRYQSIEERPARHAVEIARLFIEATKEEARRGAVVALNWNLEVTNNCNVTPVVSTIVDYRDYSMLLIDIFRTPHQAKFVRPADAEVEYAELESFNRDELVELVSFLRRHYQVEGSFNSWDSDSYLRYLQVANI